MREPRWLDPRALLSLHSEVIAEHGGLEGLRDPGLLDSALARARNLFAYNMDVTMAQLAAAYGFGLAKNHPFVDGNKRIAFVAIDLFLQINGYLLVAEQIDQINTMLQVASGDLSEEGLAAWIGTHVQKLRSKTSS
jgi:death-on-curing protein